MLIRTLILVVVAAVLATAVAATAPARTGQAPADPLTAVKLLSCDRDLHQAAFHGRMKRVRGAARMGLRFKLLERMPGGEFKPVQAEGLGRWRKSKPNKAVFAYRQVVRNLAEDAAYRSVVEFRWYDGDGGTLRGERRRSRICDQAVPLSNLRARVIGAEAADVPEMLRYSVRVTNRGRIPADNVNVRLSVDGNDAGTRSIPTVAPGDPKVIVFRAPRCQRTVEAMADPAALIDEADEADNGHLVPCAGLVP